MYYRFVYTFSFSSTDFHFVYTTFDPIVFVYRAIEFFLCKIPIYLHIEKLFFVQNISCLHNCINFKVFCKLIFFLKNTDMST